MRRLKIEGEISAKSYKKLCAKLQKFNKKQLWKVMDHYIFHIMEDKHVEELLKILQGFEQTNSFNEPGDAPPETLQVAARKVVAQFEMGNETLPDRRQILSTPITDKDLQLSKTKLDLLFDMNYFTYLTPEVATGNAKKLVTYTEKNSLPVAPHWRLIAEGENFSDLDDDSEAE